jgi:hypothetical protein
MDVSCSAGTRRLPGIADPPPSSGSALTGKAAHVKIAGCFMGLHYSGPQIQPEGYPSGQRGQTVNLLAYAFGGSNPPPSTTMLRSQ